MGCLLDEECRYDVHWHTVSFGNPGLFYSEFSRTCCDLSGICPGADDSGEKMAGNAALDRCPARCHLPLDHAGPFSLAGDAGHAARIHCFLPLQGQMEGAAPIGIRRCRTVLDRP
ncbi:hypothetical protein D3C75_801010 [compost metagenome]